MAEEPHFRTWCPVVTQAIDPQDAVAGRKCPYCRTTLPEGAEDVPINKFRLAGVGTNGISTTGKVFIGVGILVAVFVVLSMMGVFEDPNFDYCFNRFYNQGFRGDDLQVLLEACLENPGR